MGSLRLWPTPPPSHNKAGANAVIVGVVSKIAIICGLVRVNRVLLRFQQRTFRGQLGSCASRDVSGLSSLLARDSLGCPDFA